jgi:3-oxoacyl-[acyl-carrier protein] reductase
VLTDLPEVIHGVVYCPGSINLRPFNRLTAQDFLNDFQQNVLGAIAVIQYLLPRLKKADGASIVLFSTVAVKIGMPFHASIAAAKGAVEGLAKSLAAELATSKIRVNVIAPSLTDTPLASALLSSDEKREAAAKRHPLNSIGSADEIGQLVAFLIQDNSRWITGQVIGVDGG